MIETREQEKRNYENQISIQNGLIDQFQKTIQSKESEAQKLSIELEKQKLEFKNQIQEIEQNHEKLKNQISAENVKQMALKDQQIEFLKNEIEEKI